MQVLCVVLEKNVITLSVSIQNPCLDDSTPMPVKTFTDVEIKVERTNESTDGDISLSLTLAFQEMPRKHIQGVPSLAVELKESLLHPKAMLNLILLVVQIRQIKQL